MDGVFQRNGIPVKMAYGGRLEINQGTPKQFKDLIGYRGTTIDPLELFISSGPHIDIRIYTNKFRNRTGECPGSSLLREKRGRGNDPSHEYMWFCFSRCDGKSGL